MVLYTLRMSKHLIHLVISDPVKFQEKEREGDVARKVHRYDKAMHDIGQSDRTVYGEAGKKWEEDASTTEALCKVILLFVSQLL